MLHVYDLLLHLGGEDVILGLICLIFDHFHDLLDFWQIHERLQNRVKLLDVQKRALNHSLPFIFGQDLVQFDEELLNLSLQLVLVLIKPIVRLVERARVAVIARVQLLLVHRALHHS